MTKKEAVQILAILKAAYPSSYSGMTKEEASGTVAVWAMQFGDLPVDIVMMAVHKLIATNKFPPSVAEVKDKIKSIHWEAYDVISRGNTTLDNGVRDKCQRIYDLTYEYKYGKLYEPNVSFMLSGGNLQLGSGGD